MDLVVDHSASCNTEPFMLTRRQLNLAIFERTAEGVLWQPRLETWLWHHRAHGSLPPQWQELDDLQIYDALHCSVRYAACAGIVGYEYLDDIHRHSEQRGDLFREFVSTPHGTLTTVHRDVRQDGELLNRRIEKYPVNTPEELRLAIELVERRQYRADLQAFRDAEERVGQRGEPTIFLNSAGFTELIKQWCGLEGTFYLLADCPDVVAAFCEASDRADQRQLAAALQLPCRIFNLGDHATNEFTPPPILQRFMLPRWQKISEQLHAAGRFVHSHWDGNARTILPYLQESGLDSVEALTPEPQGDISLAEIKAAVGDKLVCLDLVPAIHFLEQYSMQEVLDFTREVIDLFAPRLILGISDEISQTGQIEKVAAISELVDEVCGLAV